MSKVFFGSAQVPELKWQSTLPGKLDTILEKLGITEELKDMPLEQLHEYQLTHRKEAEEIVYKSAKAFLDKVAAEHPEIPRKSITIYAQRACTFHLSLGENIVTNYLTYCVKVL